MDRRRKPKVTPDPKVPTQEERIIESLLADGAIEITPAMLRKEPYKSIYKKIKYDLIHED